MCFSFGRPAKACARLRSRNCRGGGAAIKQRHNFSSGAAFTLAFVGVSGRQSFYGDRLGLTAPGEGILGRAFAVGELGWLLFPPETVGNEVPNARWLFLNGFGREFFRIERYLHYFHLPHTVVLNVLRAPVLQLPT